MTMQERAGKEFKVRIDVELPEDVFDRIERAIQKAVLSELAETDVADGYSVVMRVPSKADSPGAAEARLLADLPPGTERPDPFGGLGSTDGIWIREAKASSDEPTADDPRRDAGDLSERPVPRRRGPGWDRRVRRPARIRDTRRAHRRRVRRPRSDRLNAGIPLPVRRTVRRGAAVPNGPATAAGSSKSCSLRRGQPR